MAEFTIGQLAAAAGVPVSTVRFYERRGVLQPDARAGNNYRFYTDNALERLRFIRASQAVGFSLGDIEALLQLAYSTDEPCADVLNLARNRLAEVRQKLGDLQRVEQALANTLDACCKGGHGDLCNDVGRLRGKSRLDLAP